MGRKLVLTGTTLTNLTAPKLATVDPIESSGSLFLLDPTHLSEQWPAGVPANTTTLPNLFWKNAATLVGGGATKASLAAYVRNVFTTITTAVKERTTKGGLHVIHPTATAAANESLTLAIPDNVKEYIRANPTHTYYLSQWTDVTRASTQTGNNIMACISSNSKFVAAFAQKTNFPSIVDGARAPLGTGVAGKSFRSVGAVPDTGFGTDADTETATNPTNSSVFIVGSRATGTAGQHSAIFYRAYLEDLTVSGRTYAQVDAIDYAMFTKEVLTLGGRYYGDTFTAVSTVA